MVFFTEGPDPENPDDLGVEKEKVDALVEKIFDELRKIGLYGHNIAVMVPNDEDDLDKYGVRRRGFMEKPPLVLMGALHVGELAWQRLGEKDPMDLEIQKLEQGLLSTDIEDIKKKYGQQEDPG